MNTLARRSIAVFVLLAVFTAAAFSGDIVSSGKKGNWSGDTTWVGGVLPGPNDNVTIADGDTVTIDVATIQIANLTVGGGTSGRLRFSKTLADTMTVSGDILVKSGAAFNVQTRSITASLLNKIVLYGNLTSNGSAFDFRNGSSGSTLGVCNIELVGSANSTLTMGTYATSNNEFNGIKINKSGNARVILGSNIYMPSGSSNESAADPVLDLTRGIIQTGPFAVFALYTNSGQVKNGSDSSYVLGNLARGMGNSSTSDRYFEVGDENGYRPVRIQCSTLGVSTGHYLLVQCIPGNADSSSSFTGTIDKVSAVRYYKMTYSSGGVPNVGAPLMAFNKYAASYGPMDGVAAGNQNLRLALGDSIRSVWRGIGPVVTPYTTTLDNPPQYIVSDNPIGPDTLYSGKFMYLALARNAGTTENTLIAETPTSIDPGEGIPEIFSLGQNFPNPFNPTTSITYQLPVAGEVTLVVYDLIGRQVATLVSQKQSAGAYTLTFDATKLSSGIYLYQLRTNGFVQTKRMVLMR